MTPQAYLMNKHRKIVNYLIIFLVIICLIATSFLIIKIYNRQKQEKPNQNIISAMAPLKFIGMELHFYKENTGKDAYKQAKNFKDLINILGLRDAEQLRLDYYKIILYKNSHFKIMPSKHGNALPLIILFIDNDALILYENGTVKVQKGMLKDASTPLR